MLFAAHCSFSVTIYFKNKHGRGHENDLCRVLLIRSANRFLLFCGNAYGLRFVRPVNPGGESLRNRADGNKSIVAVNIRRGIKCDYIVCTAVSGLYRHCRRAYLKGYKRVTLCCKNNLVGVKPCDPCAELFKNRAHGQHSSVVYKLRRKQAQYIQ